MKKTVASVSRRMLRCVRSERANRAQAGCPADPIIAVVNQRSNRICFVRDSVVRAGSAYCVDTKNKAPATAAAKIPVILNDSTTWL